MRRLPHPAVIDWFVTHDADLALPAVALAKVDGGRLATRNVSDFRSIGLDLICPWDV